MKRLRTSAKVAGGLTLAAVLLSGCLKTEEFPPEPAIGFKALEQFGDSASLTVTFTDGDGDIGLGQGDTLAPYNVGSAYYNNFIFDVQRLESGEWNFLLTSGHRIPVITPTGQNKALEGEIARAFESVSIPGFEGHWYDDFGDAAAGDTIRIDIRIIDRALHTSNTVSTGAIVLQ